MTHLRINLKTVSVNLGPDDLGLSCRVHASWSFISLQESVCLNISFLCVFRCIFSRSGREFGC